MKKKHPSGQPKCHKALAIYPYQSGSIHMKGFTFIWCQIPEFWLTAFQSHQRQAAAYLRWSPCLLLAGVREGRDKKNREVKNLISTAGKHWPSPQPLRHNFTISPNHKKGLNYVAHPLFKVKWHMEYTSEKLSKHKIEVLIKTLGGTWKKPNLNWYKKWIY